MSVSNITFQDFETTVDTNSMVILDFWAPWCAPCRVFSPIFEELAELNPDIFFGKVNTEIATDLAAAFQIKAIPTIIAFKNGELIFEQSGLLTPPQMEKLLQHIRTIDPLSQENIQ